MMAFVTSNSFAMNYFGGPGVGLKNYTIGRNRGRTSDAGARRKRTRDDLLECAPPRLEYMLCLPEGFVAV